MGLELMKTEDEFINILKEVNNNIMMMLCTCYVKY